MRKPVIKDDVEVEDSEEVDLPYMWGETEILALLTHTGENGLVYL